MAMAITARALQKSSEDDTSGTDSSIASSLTNDERRPTTRLEVGAVAINRRQPNVDAMIQDRIEKIYERLEATDTNLRNVEELLHKQKDCQQNEPQLPKQGSHHASRRSRSHGRRSSASSPSSIDQFRHKLNANAERESAVQSSELRTTIGDQRSPTLEQLHRLTQSMQDLHNYQQRFQDDLRTKVLNRSSSESVDIICQLSMWLSQNVENRFQPKEILDKLTALQLDLKSEESRKQVEEAHRLCGIEKLHQDIEDLRRNVATISMASNKSENSQKLSQLETQQFKLESSLEVLAKHFEVWFQQRNGPTQCLRCDGHQQTLQQLLEEAVRTSLDASRKVNRAADDMRRTDGSSVGTTTETPSLKDKAKRIIKQLKLKCNESEKEKDRYRRRCRAAEEKYDFCASDKEMVRSQLDDLHLRLRIAAKEQDDLKTTIAEEQMQGSNKDVTIQRLKNVHEESQHLIQESRQELYKCKLESEKLVLDNKSLCLQIEMLKGELVDCKSRLTTTNNAMDTMKKSEISADHLKDKLEVAERHCKDVVSQLSKQLESEREMRFKLEKEMSELKVGARQELLEATATKERDYQPIISLLKHQISESQGQVNDVHQENRTLETEKGQLRGELSRVQAEMQVVSKKYEKLLRNFYSKNEELHTKLHRIDELDGNFTDFRKITHKMETEYKAMLGIINTDVDRTLQMWNMAFEDSLQAPASVGGSQCHPKVILVDIQSKLRWLQDDIWARSKVNQEKWMNNLGSPHQRYGMEQDAGPVHSSSPKPPLSQQTEAHLLNIQTASDNDEDAQRLGLRRFHNHNGSRLAADDQATPDPPGSWNLSGIAKDKDIAADTSLLSEFGSCYLKNNKRQLNSTEASSVNLPQNRNNRRLKCPVQRSASLSSLSNEASDS